MTYRVQKDKFSSTNKSLIIFKCLYHVFLALRPAFLRYLLQVQCKGLRFCSTTIFNKTNYIRIRLTLETSFLHDLQCTN